MTELQAPLPWQTTQWQRLSRAIEQGRMPHALLLSGRSGTGKRLFAEALSARLLCEQPVDGRACGRCRACRLRFADSHPDLFRLEPLPEKQEILIDQVRELIEQVTLEAQRGGHRIVIIDPAQRLNAAAANGLLKVLEEPGSGVVFCLVCSEPARLPQTIRSRCQRLPLVCPDTVTALGWLRTHVDDEERCRRCLEAAFGAPLPALERALDDGGTEDLDVGADLLDLARGQRDLVEVAAHWLKIGGERSLKGLVVSLYRLERQCLVPAATATQTEQALYAIFSGAGRDLGGLHALIDRIHAALRLQGTTLNPSLLLEEIAIDWLTLCRPYASR